MGVCVVTFHCTHNTGRVAADSLALERGQRGHDSAYPFYFCNSQRGTREGGLVRVQIRRYHHGCYVVGLPCHVEWERFHEHQVEDSIFSRCRKGISSLSRKTQQFACEDAVRMI
jgi:hypothetical protein